MNSKSLHAETVSSLFGRKRQGGKTDEDEVVHEFVVDSSRENYLATRLRSLAYYRSPSSTDDPPSDAAIDSDTTVSISTTSSPEEEFEALYSDASVDLETNHSMARELETATAELQHHTAFQALPSEKDNDGESNKGDDDDENCIDNDYKGKCEPLDSDELVTINQLIADFDGCEPHESDELARLTQLILFKSTSTSKEEDRVRTSSPPLRLLNRKRDETKVTYKSRLIAFLSRETNTNFQLSSKNRLGWIARVQSSLRTKLWTYRQKSEEEIIEDCTNNGTKDDSRTSGFGGDGKTYCKDEKTNVKVKGRETRGVDAETGVNGMSRLIPFDDVLEKQHTQQNSACQRNEGGNIDSHPDDEVAVLPVSDVVDNDGQHSSRLVEYREEFVFRNTECVDDCEEFVYTNTECVDLSCSLGWHKQSEPEDFADNEKDWFDAAALDEVDNEKNWLDTAFDGVDRVLESVLNSVEKACYRERGV
jgi:hypothetical protein